MVAPGIEVEVRISSLECLVPEDKSTKLSTKRHILTSLICFKRNIFVNTLARFLRIDTTFEMIMESPLIFWCNTFFYFILAIGDETA